MIKFNTHWSGPKTTLLAGMMSLRSALASGQRAKLMRLANEDCSYPIKVKNSITDFRCYGFSTGLLQSRHQIQHNDTMPEFEKYLTLNYKTCYGTQEAVDAYYETGLLCSDNFRGTGRSHLVAVKAMIAFYKTQKGVHPRDSAKMLTRQYVTKGYEFEDHFFDHYRLKHEHDVYTIKRFKRKLWVVVLLEDNDPKPRIPIGVHVLNVLLFPMKFVPTRQVLKMPDYKVISYRIGSVVHGFSLEFHVPKKFGFSNEKT